MASPERIRFLVSEEEVKPRLRGVSHAIGFLAAVAGWVVLARVPARGAPYVGGMVFGASLVLLFGVSATYHCPNWSPTVYRRLRRCDHAAIYFLIAGSFTPMALLDTEGWGPGLLWVMWSAAIAGATLALLGLSGPRGLRSALYVVLGTVAFPVMVRLPGIIGAGRVRWLLLEVVLYGVGAVIYARKWLDWRPAFFGYHELFHLLVVIAAAVHYGVVLDVLRRP